MNCVVVAVAGIGLGLAGVSSGQNVIVDWNQIAVNAALAANQATAPGSNTQAGAFLYLAYPHLAMYDAVNAIEKRSQPYGFPIDAPSGASSEAAAVAAAYHVLLWLFPDQTASLTLQYTGSLAAVRDGVAKSDGILVGKAAADGIILMRQNDGRGIDVPYTYPVAPMPGVWVPTPPAFAAPVIPWLGRVTPFTSSNSTQFVPHEGPLPLSSIDWADEYNEVKLLGAVNSQLRNAKQTEIGLFWTDHAARQYARAFRALAIARDLGLHDSARLFAMLFSSSADALIACWNAKYQFSFWRPVTAIRNGDIDGNNATSADPAWTPLAATPAHPEYPSAHACGTGAIAATLKDFFGSPHIDLIVTSGVTNTTHNFVSSQDLEKEVSQARIYSGYHFRHSMVQGIVLGHHVADRMQRDFFQSIR